MSINLDTKYSNLTTSTYIDKQGNLFLTQKQWERYLNYDIQSYKLIPPHRFADEDFMRMAKGIVEKYIEDLNNKIKASEFSPKELQKQKKHLNDIIRMVKEKDAEANAQLQELLPMDAYEEERQ